MRRIAIFAVGLGLFLLTQNVYASLFWEYNGDVSGNIDSGLTVGTIRTGDEEYDKQAKQISGAGTLLPSGSPGLRVNFHFNGFTWDSYNKSLGDSHTGYLDVFAAVLSEEGYYWNLANIGFGLHPLENNPALILGLDPFDPTPGPDNSYWGGTSFDDGVLENKDADLTLNFATDPTKQYYLTFFLQTRSDSKYPSWGTFTNLNVSAVPEPVSTMLFLSGGLLVGGKLLIRRRRK